MGLCINCKTMLPPDFLMDVSATEKICIFCNNNITEIKYGENKQKKATKQEIAEDYQKFLKMVKEKNEILKGYAKGEKQDIPELIKPQKG